MLKLRSAQKIIKVALEAARAHSMKPLAIAVVDARGALIAFAAEDGSSLKREKVARGKADGAIALGISSRAIGKMAAERPQFVAAVSHAVGGSLIPVPGGVLIRDAKGAVFGAVGVSGDTSDNDELVAVKGIEAAGLKADTGA
ncbi:MAG: GlcG/HbpS family heme-binding protein [Beijerinckiaceae bacterium]